MTVIVIPTNWYDGALAGFAADIPAFQGPCRFECIASYDDHNASYERVFLVAKATADDIREATRLAKASIGGMMYYPPDEPEALAAVKALLKRTAHALTDSSSLLLFALDVAGAEGFVRAVGTDLDRVIQAMQREHVWHGHLEDWEDVRSQATPIGG